MRSKMEWNRSESETSDRFRDIKEALQTCLSNVKGTGTFATSHVISNAPNPALWVKDVGAIGLPLSDRDAKALVEASHQAPFGKGTETIVDTSVRKTWEINSDSFELRHPAWQGTVDGIIAKVADELGIPSGAQGIRAEPYKLLLYEEGALFKAHQE